MHRLSKFTRKRCAAATLAMTFAACASGGSSPDDLESDDSLTGWAEHDPENAPEQRGDDALAFEEVHASVDVTLDDDLPTIEGRGFAVIEEVNLPGRKVAFYEADDGSTFELVIGRAGAARRLPGERGLRGSALYEFLTHKRAPKRLLDAEERAGVSHEKPPGEGAATAATENTKRVCEGQQGGCLWNRADFRADFCRPTDRYYERLGVGRDTWLTTSGTEYQRAGVYVHSGTVRYEAQIVQEPFNDQVLYMWMLIRAGYFVGWDRTYSWSQCDTVTRVTEAAGDNYDHCSNYHF